MGSSLNTENDVSLVQADPLSEIKMKHVPGFIEKAGEFKSKDIDDLIFISATSTLVTVAEILKQKGLAVEKSAPEDAWAQMLKNVPTVSG
ncbi:hypothetical protein QQ045_006555 [Rhodiola kirilowii]